MNTNDHELLKLAAQACGIKVLLDPNGVMRNCTGMDPAMNIFAAPEWNPLNSNGDAFLLLAAIPSLWSLKLQFGAPSIEMDVAWGYKRVTVNRFNGQNTDRADVMRRTIVETAAEMEKTRSANPHLV
jgi:hypothetical protein